MMSCGDALATVLSAWCVSTAMSDRGSESYKTQLFRQSLDHFTFGWGAELP